MLAAKFPATKFLKSVSTTCIPNYPDRNLPTIFIYFEEDMKGQIVGPLQFGGMNLTAEGMYRVTIGSEMCMGLYTRLYDLSLLSLSLSPSFFLTRTGVAAL